jgi:hypothetical protein
VVRGVDALNPDDDLRVVVEVDIVRGPSSVVRALLDERPRLRRFLELVDGDDAAAGESEV